MLHKGNGEVDAVGAVVLGGGVLRQERHHSPKLQRQQQHSCVEERLAPAVAVVGRRELLQVYLQVRQRVCARLPWKQQSHVSPPLKQQENGV